MSDQERYVPQNPWVELAGRWVLGAIFIFASYHKITSPAEFAKIVYGYGLFPGVFINLIAIILPLIELVSGLALILGVFPRSAALIVTGLLGIFLAIMVINLARGHEFDCGCFSVGHIQTSSGIIFRIIREMILFFIGVYVVRANTPLSRNLLVLKG